MLIFKFEKTSTSALTAHVDMLRAVTYIFRRAGVSVEYSQGFNPHMELGFSPPLPLGVESLCEYVSVKTNDDVTLPQLNRVCPTGITFTQIFKCGVNLAAKISRATYKVEALGIGNVAEEVLGPNYAISYTERGAVVTKDVSSRIFAAKKLDENTALFTLSLGNENLRPDRVVCHLLAKHSLNTDYKITKTESFVGEAATDEYLRKMQQPKQ